MAMYINELTAQDQDFLATFRGALFEAPTGVGNYHVPFGRWFVAKEESAEKPLYRENLSTYLAHAGNLQLHSNGAVDIFHAQEVQAADQQYLMDELNPYPLPDWGDSLTWITGAKLVVHDHNFTVVSPVLFGLYTDEYNRILDQESEYEVTIYIHYQTEAQL